MLLRVIYGNNPHPPPPPPPPQLKKCKDTLCPGLVPGLLRAITAHATFIGGRRAGVTFTPKDGDAVQEWEVGGGREGGGWVS